MNQPQAQRRKLDMRSRASSPCMAIAAGVFSGCLLIGCGANIVSPLSPAPIVTSASKSGGSVHGGQQPVSGSHVYLYAAGTDVDGGAAQSLIFASYLDSDNNGYVVSDANGNFSLTETYACADPASPVYILALGGNPGLAAGTNNSNLALMAALGPCGNLTASTFINVNEVTTVGAVWALAPFMTSATGLGSTGFGLNGLLQAFAASQQIANVTTGAASGPALPANAVLPVSEINSLADLLASCINSGGGIAGDSTSCGMLFAAATPPSGTAPTDTIAAALNIAHYPANQAGALFDLVPAIGPFQPVLSSAPNDWTIAVQYRPAGLSTPKSLAIDASGNVWVANCGSPACTTAGAGSVTELGNDGSVLGSTSAGSLNIPYAIAIDFNGNAWVANYGGNSVTEISGTSLTPVAPPFTGGGLNAPNTIAIDNFSNVWLTNAGTGTVTELSGAGAAVTPAGGFAGVTVSSPVSIVVVP